MTRGDLFLLPYLSVGDVSKRHPSQTPYLVEQAAIAPYVTGRGVLSVVHGFRGRPSDLDPPTFCYVIAHISEVSRLAKSSNLCAND